MNKNRLPVLLVPALFMKAIIRLMIIILCLLLQLPVKAGEASIYDKIACKVWALDTYSTDTESGYLHTYRNCIRNLITIDKLDEFSRIPDEKIYKKSQYTGDLVIDEDFAYNWIRKNKILNRY